MGIFVFLIIVHSVFLGLGMITGYFGVARSLIVHMQRKLSKSNAKYKSDQNQEKLIDAYGYVVRISTHSKELSIFMGSLTFYNHKNPYQIINICFCFVISDYALNSSIYSNIL